MHFEWAGSFSYAMNAPLDFPALLICALSALFVLVILLYYRQEWRFPPAKWVFFALDLLMAVVCPLVLRVHLSPMGSPLSSTIPPVPLLACVPIVIAAVWFGHAPATLAGFLAGFSVAASSGMTTLQMFEGALFGYSLAWSLRQPFAGGFFAALRQPLIAVPLLSFALWPIPAYAYLVNPTLWAGLMAPSSLPFELMIPVLFMAFLFGGILQSIFVAMPQWRPPLEAPSPQEGTSLAGRLRFQMLPLILGTALLSLVGVYAATTRITFDRSLREMETSAEEVANALADTMQASVKAADTIISAGGFGHVSAEQWQASLESLSFGDMPFHQIILLDRNANVVGLRSFADIAASPVPTEEEITAIAEALAAGHIVLSRTYWLSDAQPAITVVAPMLDVDNLNPRGVMLGRLVIRDSPTVAALLESMEARELADGTFFLDERGTVLIGLGTHQRANWVANAQPLLRYNTYIGQAYAEQSPEGGLQLTYWRRLEQPAWHFVLEKDQASIMHEAWFMARPILILLLIAYAALAFGITFMVQKGLFPLGQLAQAATRIAEGELDAPLPRDNGREDEIGRLVAAIKRMNIGLGAGVKELARLVEVTQNVSARANLDQTVGILLRAVCRGLDARSAGIYLLSHDGTILKRFAEGESSLPAQAELYFEELAEHTWRNAVQTVVPDVNKEHADVPLALLARAEVSAFVMLPILREGRTFGAMWALWPRPRSLSTTDLHFLAAIASLGGIMIENSRIYHAVEGERSRLAVILKSTSDGILVLDSSGRLQLANPAAEKLLDFRVQDKIGQPLPTLIAHEELYRVLSSIARGHGPSTTEIDRYGSRLSISASTIQLSGKPAPQGWVLVMRDITNVKRLDELQTEFMDQVTHDMKTPLTYVRGYASMLKNETTSEHQLEYVEKILKGIDDLTQLINELSELAKVSTRVGMTMTPCSLSTVVREVAETMRTYAEGKGLTLRLDLPADVPNIVGDPDRLKRAIRNLVDNAIKYTPPPGWVKITIRNLTSTVMVVVADSGIGISEEDRRRIFEKFYRVRRRETLHIHGTGLGLALVKEVAEQHGGQVWVESEVGAGSVFYFSIPKDRRLGDVLEEASFLSHSPKTRDVNDGAPTAVPSERRGRSVGQAGPNSS